MLWNHKKRGEDEKTREKIVITFHTTTDAMAMERYCKKRRTGQTDSCSGYDLGRMRTCMVRSAAREGTSLKVMEEGDITPQAVHECML